MHKKHGKLGSKDGFSLLLLSFLILFFELICIRWISSTLSHVGLFNNIILLASFLGIGLGCLLHDKKINLIEYFPPLVFFLILILSSGILTSNIYSRALYDVDDTPVYVAPAGKIVFDSHVLLTVIFAFVTLLFTTLSQDLGRLFPKFPPLKAYSLNIAGSIMGIITFSFLSYLSTGPILWFLLFYLLLILYNQLHLRSRIFTIRFFIFLPVTLVGLYFMSYGLGQTGYDVYWSPYYRIEKIGHIIVVNDMGHQAILVPPTMDPVHYPPRYLFNESFEDVLIIGSGAGTDTAVALYYNNSRVDAVEIDPLIIEIGRKYHPTQPYSDPRVTVINDDARSYLMKTDKKYDLIVYGLTDSLTLLSTYGSLRLESYLYTVDAFREVREHLTEDGLFVTGNHYPKVWFADKLVVMLEQSFNQTPHVITFPAVKPGSQVLGETENILTFSGPRIEKLKERSVYEVSTKVTPSTDDWPFFYMQNPSIPDVYRKGLMLILAFTLVLFLLLGKTTGYGRINPHFFFLGAAFMLLETKSIINFSLLFGATWLVNSLVFTAILVMVLAAIYFVSKHSIKKIKPWYVLLFALLFLNYITPLKFFLSFGQATRFILSSILFFSPIFAANVIFSSSFKKTSRPHIDYASNILGAVIGGIAEYLSLLTGYQNIVVLIGVFYLLAFYKRGGRK